MPEVVFLRHQGVPCAVPAQQVNGATETTEETPLLLFDAASTGHTLGRCLEVVTPEGTKPLPCDIATFGSIEEKTMLPLSDLVSDELNMPHLVGILDGDDEVVWLIDLTRWRSNYE